MLSLDDLLIIMNNIIRELRYRYGESYVEGIKVRQSKYEVFINIAGRKGKIIIDKNTIKIRVYTGLRGQEISIRRIVMREIEKYKRLSKQ